MTSWKHIDWRKLNVHGDIKLHVKSHLHVKMALFLLSCCVCLYMTRTTCDVYELRMSYSNKVQSTTKISEKKEIPSLSLIGAYTIIFFPCL